MSRADAPTASPAASESSPPWVTRQDEAAMAGSPISQERPASATTGTTPSGGRARGRPVAVTSPDIPADHQATEPDMFGTTRRTGEETAEMPAAPAEGQPGAATIADVPAARADVPAARTPAGEAPAGVAPAGDTGAPAGDVPATAAEATGSSGRHAAATTADGDLRPGEAAGNAG